MLSFEKISKSFSGRLVLNELSFSLEEGETLVIVGPSGTGKSVTLKNILGLITPDSGRILFKGKNTLEFNSKETCDYLSHFGVLFQSAALLGWMTVEQNIALPLLEKRQLSIKEIEDRVAKAIDIVQLNGSENKLPSEISGGMQKRAGLARAIVTEPEIVLYDEPTSGLDPVMSRRIDKLIVDMKDNLNVSSIVVTHDLHSAFTIADRIAMLNAGGLAFIGTPEDFVKSSNAEVKEFINAQFTTGKLGDISQWL